ncbi:MAG: V-type ATP synthase subunit I [Tissierellia bacterium]|nr:V-type ATP synthase subunit I [Tissierellia bacterium]
MAIVDMSRFSLLAFQADREKLLEQLQAFREVHFLDLRDKELSPGVGLIEPDQRLNKLEEDLGQLEWMLKLLKPYDTRPTGLKGMQQGLPSYSLDEVTRKAETIDFKKDYYEIREIQAKLDQLTTVKNDKKASFDALSPWEKLPFYPDQLSDLKHVRVQLGMVARKFMDNLAEAFRKLEFSHYEIINEAQGNYYLQVIGHVDEADALQDVLRRNGFTPVKLEIKQPVRQELDRLTREIAEAEQEQDQWQKKLPGYAPRLSDYELVYEAKANQLLKLGATRNFLQTDRLTLIQGYVPTVLEEEFRTVLDNKLGNDYHVEITPAERNDSNVPIKLKNNKFVESFASITSMYALPKYNEIDPTPFFTPFYWMFFGMMVADIGYGIILLVGTFVLLKKFNLAPSMRGFVRFFHYLSYSITIWGVIYGSFFGDLIPLPSLIEPSTDIVQLLILNIAFGFIHLMVGLAISAYMIVRDSSWLDALYDIGFWYMTLIGGILLLIAVALKWPPLVSYISGASMLIGMIGVVVFTGRKSRSGTVRVLKGLYNLYGISSYVGDFVSYTRLMAIGLAGAFIGVAVNIITKLLLGSFIGIPFGIVVFLAFHAFNIFLSALSAYVHTSRLTYVEFFGKFYSGGGKPFTQFINDTKYITIKEKD